LCIIVSSKDDVAAFKNYQAGAAAAAPRLQPAKPQPSHSASQSTAGPTTQVTAAAGDRVFATPYARTLATEKGIDLKVRCRMNCCGLLKNFHSKYTYD